MYQVILSTHIILGIATLLTTMVASVAAKKTNARKYLYALVAGLTLQIVSGTYMALLSETVTAISLCQNLAIYSIVVAVGCVSMYFKSEKMDLRHYLYMGAPALASYSIFALAIIKKI
jgi:heme A synthase